MTYDKIVVWPFHSGAKEKEQHPDVNKSRRQYRGQGKQRCPSWLWFEHSSSALASARPGDLGKDCLEGHWGKFPHAPQCGRVGRPAGLPALLLWWSLTCACPHSLTHDPPGHHVRTHPSHGPDAVSPKGPLNPQGGHQCSQGPRLQENLWWISAS